MQLVVQSGAEPGRAYDLVIGNKISAGRQSTNQIVVNDEQVSRKHVDLDPVPEGLLVTDLNSSNGTYVNGTRISSPITLKPGDTLQVGTTVLKLVDNQDGARTVTFTPEAPAASTMAFDRPVSAFPGSGTIDNQPRPATPPSSGADRGYSVPASTDYGYGQSAAAPSSPSQPSMPDYGAMPEAGGYGQPNYNQPPQSTPASYGQAGYDIPQQPNYNQSGGYGQAQGQYGQAQQPSYGQPPAGYGQQQPYGQPGYNQPGNYPQQGAYAQPQAAVSPKKKGNPLLIILPVVLVVIVLAVVAFLLVGGGGDLPTPPNSTKIDLTSSEQSDLAKNLKDTNYNYYTSKDDVSSLDSFYRDKMKAKGYTVDSRSTSSGQGGQIVFLNNDKAALVLLVKLDAATIADLEKSAASFKGKLKEGDTLVALAEGKSSTLK